MSVTNSEEVEVLVSNLSSPAGPAIGFGESGEVEQHSKRVKEIIEKADPSEFFESWQKAVRAVAAVFKQDEGEEDSDFELESIKAKLSLSASGKVAFVGEFGGQVAFEATFKRKV